MATGRAYLEHRQQLNYPPAGRFVELELRHNDEEVLERESKQCADYLQNYLATYHAEKEFTILGPARPPVHKIKNIFSRKIYIKATSYGIIHQACKELLREDFQIQIFFTPNPLQ